MNRKEWVHILFDTSGSMDEYWDELIEALNDELETYRNPVASMGLSDVEVSVTPFSDTMGETLTFRSPAELPAFDGSEWVADGLTAFYDAMGETLHSLKAVWEVERQSGPVKFTVLAFTAGGDNASRRFSLPYIRRMIRELEATGDWEFRFPVDGPDDLEVEGVLTLRRRHKEDGDESAFRRGVMALFFEEVGIYERG